MFSNKQILVFPSRSSTVNVKNNKLIEYNITPDYRCFLTILFLNSYLTYFLSLIYILAFVQFSLKLSISKTSFKIIPTNLRLKFNTPNPQLKTKDLRQQSLEA